MIRANSLAKGLRSPKNEKDKKTFNYFGTLFDDQSGEELFKAHFSYHIFPCFEKFILNKARARENMYIRVSV